MPEHHPIFRPDKRQLLLLFVLALAIYVIVPQIGDFHRSIDLLKHINWSYALAAVAFTAFTYMIAGATYCLLAFQSLRYWTTVLVQLAGMFINRLLPAGLGSLGANYAYLSHRKHTKTQAATVVAVNNTLGFAGHILLTLVVVALFHSHLPPIHFRYSSMTWVWFKWAAIPIAILIILSIWQWGWRIKQGLANVWKQLTHYKKRPRRVVYALLTSMGLTLCNVAALWFCLLALHGSLPFIAVLLVFTLGIALGSATPTPGGLGGVEASLVAGFVAFHITSVQALATVLLYRLISYWLSLIVGIVAFVAADKQDLFRTVS